MIVSTRTTMPLTKPLKIAIIGAGPAGLAQVIHLQRLADVELSVYEGATELKEVGAVSQRGPAAHVALGHTWLADKARVLH
jgi:2-polyprenyl-6-methoxyphenol hydroxylase-like FAD-dependent oxidoreductase